MRIPIAIGHFIAGQGAPSTVYLLYTRECATQPCGKMDMAMGIRIVLTGPNHTGTRDLDNTGSTCQQPQDNTDTKHTGNDAGMSTDRRETVFQQAWEAISKSRLLAKIILVLVLLLLVFIAWRAMKTPQWIFSIKAQTGIIELEAPIHISKVALVCSHCDEWTRVGYTYSDGVKVRMCRRCGEVID